MEQLSPQDAQFIYLETATNLAHVTNVSIFDPSTVPGNKTVRFKDIVAHIENRMAGLPLLKRRLVHVPMELDFPYWADDEYFDIEYHVNHSRLPLPGDWRQLCIQVARFHSRPLDMNRPLWEIRVIEGLDHIDGLPEGCYAVCTKIHHSVVDGASIVRFFSALLDKDKKGTPVMELPVSNEPPCPPPGVPAMLRRTVQSSMRAPFMLANTLLNAGPNLYNAAQNALTEDSTKKTKVPYTRFNRSVSPHKMFDAIEFSLDSFKTIRQLVPDCKINDVVLAVTSGALRRYLQHHDELPAESLIAWIPINARPGGAVDTDGSGNRITAMTAPIHTHIENPRHRLQAIFKSTQDSKKARAGLGARLITDLVQHIPASTQSIASKLALKTGIAAKMCNLFVSNVPGPPIQMYMNGARHMRSYGMAPLSDGMGLFIATPSYNGKLSMSVTSTREIMPDIRFFVSCLQESHTELVALAQQEIKSKNPAGSTVRRKAASTRKNQKTQARDEAK